MHDEREWHEGRLCLWAASSKDVQEALVSGGPKRFFVPPYVGHRGWVGLRLDHAEVDWDEVAETELVKHVAAQAGLTGEQAKTVVDAVFDSIAGELAAGRDVAIAGFGKFSLAERAAWEGRNPATGETIQIAASRAAKFSAAAALKSQLNG